MPTKFSEIPVGSDLKEIPFSKRNGALEVLAMRRDPFKHADERHAKFGRVSGINAFGQRIVVASGPAAADELLMNKKKAFANGPAWSYLIGPFFNRGVMLLDFDEHRHHRLILQQAFNTKVLKGYMDAMQPMIRRRMEQFPTGDVLLFKGSRGMRMELILEQFLKEET